MAKHNGPLFQLSDEQPPEESDAEVSGPLHLGPQFEQYFTTFESVVDFIIRLVLHWGRDLLETGGELYGLWTHNRRPVIFLATPPGKNAIHQYAHFAQDPEWFLKLNSYLRERFGIVFVGRWHAHHVIGLAEPSSGDLASIRSIAERNNIPQLIEIVATISDRTNRVDLNCFYYGDTLSGNSVRCPLKIIPGISPIEYVLRKEAPHLLSVGHEARTNLRRHPVLIERPSDPSASIDGLGKTEPLMFGH